MAIKKWTKPFRVCSICFSNKPTTEFDRNTTFCKDCRRIKVRDRMRGQPGKVAEWNRKKVRREELRPEKPCAGCKRILPIENFDFQNKARGWRASRCQECRVKYTKEYRRKNLEKSRQWSREHYRRAVAKDPEKFKIDWLKQRCEKYGVTVEWWNEQFTKQNGVCALCLKPEISERKKGSTVRSLAIDHHHENGTARGLLCSACNQAIGKIEAASGWLERAIKYLKET